jgi:hypothetical protein
VAAGRGGVGKGERTGIGVVGASMVVTCFFADMQRGAWRRPVLATRTVGAENERTFGVIACSIATPPYASDAAHQVEG